MVRDNQITHKQRIAAQIAETERLIADSEGWARFHLVKAERALRAAHGASGRPEGFHYDRVVHEKGKFQGEF